MSKIAILADNLKSRPHWMNGLLLFCAYMTFIYLPWDIFLKPLAEDQEVWFGFLFTGWAAKVGALVHWIVYGAGTWGFWKMKAWMHPWASLYILQIAIGMFLWSIMDEQGSGIFSAALTALVFVALALLMWRSKNRFGEPTRISEELESND